MRTLFITIFIISLTFIIGAATLPDYGVTWDEPGNFAAGRVYVKFITTGDTRYLRPDLHYDLTRSFPFVLDPRLSIYPPVANTLASFSSFFLAERTNILSINTAHHVIAVFFCALLVGSIYVLTLIALNSQLAAFFTATITFLYPALFSQMHNNTKDIPLVSLFTLSITLFVASIRRRSVFLQIFSGFVWGLALSTKLNALFILPILILWMVFAFKSKIHFSPGNKLWHIQNVRLDVFLFPIIGLLTMIAVWPWLWADPARRLIDVIQYFLSAGWGLSVFYQGQLYQAGVTLPWHYPWVAIIISTPPLLLFLSTIGFVTSLIKGWKKNPYLLLFPIWFLLPLLRFFSKSVIIYAGLRHVLEVIPALLILSALGLLAIKDITTRRFGKRTATILTVLLGGVTIGHLLVTVIRFHPHQSSYYNFLVGGAKGAQQIIDVEFWGESVKGALDYLDALPGKKVVYSCDTYHLARIYRFKTLTFTADPKKAEYVVLLSYTSWFGPNFVRDYLPYGTVIKTIEVDGAVLSTILKHQPGTPAPVCGKSDVQPPNV